MSEKIGNIQILKNYIYSYGRNNISNVKKCWRFLKILVRISHPWTKTGFSCSYQKKIVGYHFNPPFSLFFVSFMIFVQNYLGYTIFIFISFIILFVIYRECKQTKRQINVRGIIDEVIETIYIFRESKAARANQTFSSMGTPF